MITNVKHLTNDQFRALIKSNILDFFYGAIIHFD